MLEAGFELWKKTRDKLEQVSDLALALSHQPLPRILIQKSADMGGNSLGLGDAPDLVNVLLTASWDEAQDIDIVERMTRSLILDIEVESKARGFYHPFKDLNYCHKDQDPLNSYMAGRVSSLREVSARYDSNELFQKACPGGLNIWLNSPADMEA